MDSVDQSSARPGDQKVLDFFLNIFQGPYLKLLVFNCLISVCAFADSSQVGSEPRSCSKESIKEKGEVFIFDLAQSLYQ